MVGSVRTAGGANVHALRREVLLERPTHLGMLSRGLHSIRSVVIYAARAGSLKTLPPGPELVNQT